MRLVDGSVVVKMSRQGNGLVIGTAADVLHTRFFISTFVSSTGNDICAVVARPSRCIDAVGVVERGVVTRCIVYCKLEVERKPFQQSMQVEINTCVKLELASGVLVVTGCIVVGKDIAVVNLASAKEHAVEDIAVYTH